MWSIACSRIDSAVALAPPFYVLVAQQQAESGLLGLGALIIANGLASSISAPFWGYLGDRSSRRHDDRPGLSFRGR